MLFPSVAQDELECRLDALIGIRDTVDMADLVAIVGWDWHLDNAVVAAEKFQNDLRVEMPAVGQAMQIDSSQGLRCVGAITGVELGEARAQQVVLDRCQDLVAE